MKRTEIADILQLFKQKTLTFIIVLLISVLLSGTSSALFLYLLDESTRLREVSDVFLVFLPLGGLLIVWFYRLAGQEVQGGNNTILNELHIPTRPVPWIMAPAVLAGTLITHLFGGSAGREGTAVQMGASLTDSFSFLGKLSKEQRRVLLQCGMAGGFASVFGTPWAGLIFALEVPVRKALFSQINIRALIPVMIAAWGAHLVCMAWGATHTHYEVLYPGFELYASFYWLIPAAIAFGLAGWIFALSMHWFSKLIARILPDAYVRVLIGGSLIAVFFVFTGMKQYIGLGIPIILQSFEIQALWYDFLFKIILTTLTLAVGFKGGEVTPLFFTGAVLGSALSAIIPVPVDVLAACGFVAVFAAATRCPFACSIMGIELFGWQLGPLLIICCFIANGVSRRSIYEAQKI